MADQIVLSTASAGMVDYPTVIQATGPDPGIGYSAQDHTRAVLNAQYKRGGVIGLSHLKVTQRAGGATFGIDIAPGQIIVPGTSIINQGKYLCTVTSTVQLPTPTAPVSGSRTHRLVAEVLDKQVVGSSYGWQFRLLEAVDSVSVPAAPANSETIALILISSGQASVLDAHITDHRFIQGSRALWSSSSVFTSTTEGVFLSIGIPSLPSGHGPTQKYSIEFDGKYLANGTNRPCRTQIRQDNPTTGVVLDTFRTMGVNTTDHELHRLAAVVSLAPLSVPLMNWFYITAQTSAFSGQMIAGHSLKIHEVE